jgi:hypothetical protein
MKSECHPYRNCRASRDLTLIGGLFGKRLRHFSTGVPLQEKTAT